ncbi:MAG TPA: hypothetical protein DCZ72_11885 [Armatimonadetes bacterium]|nr:hypothetical protein [Armatimonadota bacterium]
MLTCRRAEQLLAAATVAPLSVRQARQLAAHLAGCPACRAEQAALERTVGLLAEAPLPAGRPDLWDAIAARLDAAHAPARRAPLRLGWALGGFGALVATAALLLVVLWPGGLTPAPTPTEPTMAALAADDALDSDFLIAHQWLASRGSLGNGALADLWAAPSDREDSHQ